MVSQRKARSTSKVAAGRKQAVIILPKADHRVIRAAILDRLADAELQHGHIAVAEQLAHRAEALREMAR